MSCTQNQEGIMKDPKSNKKNIERRTGGRRDALDIKSR